MKTPGKIFAVNAHLGACISCYLYCLHGALVVIKFAKLSSQMKNSKQKSPLEPRKTNKQTSPKKKRKETFLCRKEKKNLSESCEDSLSSLPELSVLWFVLVLIRTFTDSSCHRLFFCLWLLYFSSMRQREKTCCNAMLFLGNPDPEEVCSFIRLAR